MGSRVAGLPMFDGVDRTLVMGVVNVTPDSFSDGGAWFEAPEAIRHGMRLLDQGADILDVGGESTRPGAGRVAADEELARVLPVVSALAGEGAVVSVDTTRALVASRSLEAGARIVNDVSGALRDPAMAALVAKTGAAYICAHWRKLSDVFDREASDDVVGQVYRELARRLAVLRAAGVRDHQVIVDPGLGFTTPDRANWPLLARVTALRSLGRPVLVGASRKRFLGHLLADPGGAPAPPTARDDATAAITALAAREGVWGVRVHAVKASADVSGWRRHGWRRVAW